MRRYAVGIMLAMLSVLAIILVVFPATVMTKSSRKTTATSTPLMLGGKHFNGHTLEDAGSLWYATLSIDPEDSQKMNSFANVALLTDLRVLSIKESNLNTVDLSPLAFLTNLEALFISETNFGFVDLSPLAFLANLERLGIYDGINLASVDLSPLASLLNLERLFIDGNISNLPDLTPLNKLSHITIKNSDLESLVGLGAPGMERLEIIEMETFETLAPLSNLPELRLLHIVTRRTGSFTRMDLSNVPRLEFLTIMTTGGPLDVTGIERLTGLAYVNFQTTGLVNPQSISGLYNLKSLSMTLVDENPFIEYLRGMQGLHDLYIEGVSFWRNRSEEPYQVLDVSPLANNHNLEGLSMRHFIIKNIASLNNLRNLHHGDNLELGKIDLIGSRLFDENDKSVHDLDFEGHGH